MHLNDLKVKTPQELVEMAQELELENLGRKKKHDIVYAIMKHHAKQKEEIFGSGVLNILPDGFGFLRSPFTSYVAASDDIYISPNQIRRFGLRTGDSIEGKIRPPKGNDGYFALLKINTINDEPIENTRKKNTF